MARALPRLTNVRFSRTVYNINEFSGELPDLGHISTIKDVCREACPEDRPTIAEASLRQSYEGASADLEAGIDPDLEASAEGILSTSEQDAMLMQCFQDCEGPLRNRFGFGRAVCGQALTSYGNDAEGKSDRL